MELEIDYEPSTQAWQKLENIVEKINNEVGKLISEIEIDEIVIDRQKVKRPSKKIMKYYNTPIRKIPYKARSVLR